MPRLISYYTVYVSLSSQLEHRLDAARRLNNYVSFAIFSTVLTLPGFSFMTPLYRDAQEGFHKCSLCGFDNFKRFLFCSVCGGRLRLLECDFVVTSFETLIESSPTNIHGLRMKRDVVGARQRRARCVLRLYRP